MHRRRGYRRVLRSRTYSRHSISGTRARNTVAALHLLLGLSFPLRVRKWVLFLFVALPRLVVAVCLAITGNSRLHVQSLYGRARGSTAELFSGFRVLRLFPRTWHRRTKIPARQTNACESHSVLNLTVCGDFLVLVMHGWVYFARPMSHGAQSLNHRP